MPTEALKENIQADPVAPLRRGELRTYLLTWLGVIALTMVSFGLSRIKVGGWEVIAALLIAGTQAALALYWFMHLCDEKARIFRVLIPLVLIILVIFMSLTFSDVAFRG